MENEKSLMSRLYEMQDTYAFEQTSIDNTIPHCIINANKRTITVPEEIKSLGVQYDHRSNIVVFEIDRYIDDVDLLTQTCIIQWMNFNDTKENVGLYPVTSIDFSVEGKLIFTWEIHNESTQLPGTIAFAVRFYSMQDENSFLWSYNTLPAQSTILDTLDVVVRSSTEIEPSILMAWTERMAQLEQVARDAINVSSQSAKEAEAWAHGRADYPSLTLDNAKYYAEMAKAVYDDAKESIETEKNSIVNEIYEVRDDVVASVNETKDNVISEVNETKDNVISEVNETKNSVISEVTTTRDECVVQIENAAASAVQIVTNASDAVKDLGDEIIEEVQQYGTVQVSEEEPTSEHVDVWINPGEDVEISIPEIKDDIVNYEDTWSSAKIKEELSSTSNAIICDASGKSIVVTDSSNGGLKSLRLFGKSEQFTTTGAQLFDVSKMTTQSSGGFTSVFNDDGSITVNGTPTTQYAIASTTTYLTGLEPGTYYISGGSTNGGCVIAQINRKLSDETTKYTSNGAFTVDGTEIYIRLNIQTMSAGLEPVNNYTIYPMLNKGSTPLPYEPYTGGIASPNPSYPQRLKSIGKGKNLLQNTATSQTVNGITFTVNDDGSITANGTVTGDRATFQICDYNSLQLEENQTYILSGCPNGGSVNTYRLQFWTNSGSSYDYDSGATVHYTNKANDFNISIILFSGATVNNLVFYPMIRYADIEDATYEPYSKDDIEVGVYGGNLFDKNNVRYMTGIACEAQTLHFYYNGNQNIRMYYMDAEPNTSYFISKTVGANLRVCTCPEAPSDGGKITSINANTSENSCVMTTGSEDKYIAFYLLWTSEIDSGITYESVIDTLMVAKGDTATSYEPHTKQSLTALTPNGLPGIKVTDPSIATYTDEAGQMWCADEVDFERGVYVKRIESKTTSVNDIYGIDNTYVSNGGAIAHVHGSGAYYDYNVSSTICDKLISISHGDRINGEYGQLHRCYVESPYRIVFRYPISAGEKTLDEAKADFVGAKLYYILATPIETPLSEDELAQYLALHSNYPVTTVLNDSEAHMEVKYSADTKNHIDQNYVSISKYNELESRINALEAAIISN